MSGLDFALVMGFALAAGIGSSVMVLALFRLLLGLTPMAEPTKWAIGLSAGWTFLSTVNRLFSADVSVGEVSLSFLASMASLAMAWYVWVVKPKRAGRYYG